MTIHQIVNIEVFRRMDFEDESAVDSEKKEEARQCRISTKTPQKERSRESYDKAQDCTNKSKNDKNVRPSQEFLHRVRTNIFKEVVERFHRVFVAGVTDDPGLAHRGVCRSKPIGSSVILQMRESK